MVGVVVALLPSGRIDCETGGDDVLMLNLSKVNNSSCRWKFSSCCAVCAHYYSAVQQYLGTVVPQYMYEGYESRNTTRAYLVHPYIPTRYSYKIAVPAIVLVVPGIVEVC